MEQVEDFNDVESGAFSVGVAGDAAGGNIPPQTESDAMGGPQNGALPVVSDFRPMPPWVRVALREIGQHEKVGPDHNKRILQYHATTTLKATADEVPWCSSFVNWVMLKAQMERTDSAAAKSWLEWGYALEKPIYGAVVVLSRQGGNHVGFFIDETADGKWLLLGGNQGNEVNESGYDADRVIGVRWPHGWAELDFRAKD
jgi:uncharacterized protein (TIGR02594 family)